MKKFSGIEKVAIFLSIVGDEIATEIFKHLDSQELARIVPLMTKIEVTPEEINMVMEDFHKAAGTVLIGVDEEYIRKILINAFGQSEVEKLMERIEGGGSAFDMLRWLDSSSITNMLLREHPQTIAIVLAHLESTQASEVLSKLPEHLKVSVSLKIANLHQVSPVVLKELEDVLQGQMQKHTRGKKVGGARTVAEILNQMDRASEDLILKSIEERDKELAEEIRKLMFTFDDLIHIDDRGIQMLLKEITTDDLALSLKMASDELKAKIFKNMSQRAVQILKEEMETRGAVKVSDVEKAQVNITKTAKRLEEDGRIVIGGKGEEDVVV
ncbi:flagellar motor switch protein FliG [Thermodesulfovibrionales bacterium]|nr:flagellar motor switch protein FliG [Thermodesulfovibrionales bacterium]